VPVGAETIVAESQWPKVVTAKIRRFPKCAATLKRGNEGAVADAADAQEPLPDRLRLEADHVLAGGPGTLAERSAAKARCGGSQMRV
jgi:hypothetical protein